ncbi:MAG: dioxygenase [Piscirickettsiaceae bacterium]|nr:dioxygenase [Piscirickettsiaceae bacterium]
MKHSPNILFLSHGGGPMPLLGDEGHKEMVNCLQDIATKIIKPSAIIVVSAHWEEAIPTITSGAAPSLIYDYYGFPQESYNIKYPCTGEPQLANQIYSLLKNAGIDTNLDEKRGFDHGLFVPLKIMYPNADIPCVQLSLVNSLDPDGHMNIGAALQKLDYKNLLVIGSGFSFHNMKAFFESDINESKEQNEAFDTWLIETCSNSGFSEKEREIRLSQWDKAPFARYCHPREEHLLPLHVCYGIAQKSCSEYFELKILNKKSSMYLWSID